MPSLLHLKPYALKTMTVVGSNRSRRGDLPTAAPCFLPVRQRPEGALSMSASHIATMVIILMMTMVMVVMMMMMIFLMMTARNAVTMMWKIMMLMMMVIGMILLLRMAM